MSVPGYLLVIGHSINGEIMAGYNNVLPPIYEKFGGFYLGLGAPGQGVEHLEGDWFDHSLMLARFNNPDDVTGFWYSPEYEEAKKLREGGGDFNIFRLFGNEHEAPLGDPAFLISFYRLTNESKYASYAKAEEEKVNDYDGNYLTRTSADQAKRLEGDLSDHNINVITFSSETSAKSFWEDSEYKRIREDRSKFSSFNTYLVLGKHRAK